jgi:hypothetical protein
MKTQTKPKQAIQIGVTPEAIEAAMTAIMAILSTDVDPGSRQEALRTLAHLCHISNTTISGNHFVVE